MMAAASTPSTMEQFIKFGTDACKGFLSYLSLLVWMVTVVVEM